MKASETSVTNIHDTHMQKHNPTKTSYIHHMQNDALKQKLERVIEKVFGQNRIRD